MKKLMFTFTIIISLLMLSGCLYPDERLAKNQIPNELQLEAVQKAVTEYKEANQGLLPIKNRDSNTPIFHKYPVDLKKLKQYGYLSFSPGNSFEQGGYYQYVIVHPETNPTVKVLDLRLTDKIRTLNVQLQMYRNEHIYPPFGKEIAFGVYELDYKKLSLDEPQYIVSPYTMENLPIVLHASGSLAIDYRKDLYKLLREKEHSYQNGDDIRYLFTDYYPIVPAYSLPYTIKNGEPVFNLTK